VEVNQPAGLTLPEKLSALKQPAVERFATRFGFRVPSRDGRVENVRVVFPGHDEVVHAPLDELFQRTEIGEESRGLQGWLRQLVIQAEGGLPSACQRDPPVVRDDRVGWNLCAEECDQLAPAIAVKFLPANSPARQLPSHCDEGQRGCERRPPSTKPAEEINGAKGQPGHTLPLMSPDADFAMPMGFNFRLPVHGVTAGFRWRR